MTVFDEASATQIEAAIAAVEKKTAGEVVVATSTRSGRYFHERITFGAAVGFTSGLAVHAVAPALGATWIFLAQLVAGLATFLLASLPPVLRLLVGGRELERIVGEAALRTFAERGIFDTRERTGVLVFLSELERRAVVLGDKGIHARVGAEGWARLVGELTASLAAHHGADGVCRVVAEIGEVLARDVPPRPDDTNELPNAVVQTRRERR
jgi:putative membrane protein